MTRSPPKFSDSEIAGLTRCGFAVASDKKMAEIISGEITVAVLSGRRVDGLFQLIIRFPNGLQIFCSASPSEMAGLLDPA